MNLQKAQVQRLLELEIKEAQTAILIKVFTNYLQIISTISTFQLQVPVGLASVINSVVILLLAYSLDCFLVNYTDLLIIYFQIIWNLIMTSSYIIVIFSLVGIAIITKQIKFNFSFITTSLIYLFIFLQPNLIGGIISRLSYRRISDEYWIQGNVTYRYDTIQHAKWAITFCLPLLIIFCCLAFCGMESIKIKIIQIFHYLEKHGDIYIMNIEFMPISEKNQRQCKKKSLLLFWLIIMIMFLQKHLQSSLFYLVIVLQQLNKNHI